MYEKLPQELKDYPYFCGWKYETRNGSRTKVPKSFKGHNADNSNLNDFCGFDEIIEHIENYDGIGIAITGDIAAIDIDHCIEDGKLSEMIVSKVNTYTEVSPSGKGIRMIGKTSGFSYDKEKYYINNRRYGLEVYAARDKGQFVTITGNAIEDKPIRDITDVLTEILETYMLRPVIERPECSIEAPGSFLTDDEVIEKASASVSGGQYYYSCSNHRRKKGEYRCPYSKGWRQDKIDSLMANIIVQIANNEQFREDMNSRLGKAVDTSEFEAQIEMLTKQIRNKTKTLKRKQMTIDEFDWDVENADTLYDALNEDYVRLHNEVLALEKSLGEVQETIKSIQSQQITQNSVYRFILEFGKVYKDLPEINKKEMVNHFIEQIEIFPEEKEDGSVIKSVTFRFPITIGGKPLDKVDFSRQTSGNNVETVVRIERK
jgi:hypothetical protein